MNRILIWGTGQKSKYVFDSLERELNEVIAMVDNNVDVQGTLWNGAVKVISPNDITNYDFDYIVISVVAYTDIEGQCKQLGIAEHKIIPFWEDSHEPCQKNRSWEIVELKERIKNLEELMKIRSENVFYEGGDVKRPIVKSGAELLNKMIKDHSSLVRFGDGEFELLLMKARPWFQEPNSILSEHLNEVLNSELSEINIGICNMFGNLNIYKDSDADAKRIYMLQSRSDIYRLLDFDRVYYDANVTRPYIEHKNQDNAVEIFGLFKELFKNRKILIVEGKGANNGVNNDLYSGAKVIRRVECPVRNAWDKYEEIYKGILNLCDRDWLICISLGPTATVLAYDLAKAGYQAVDIGQIDNEYDWFVRGASKREDIPGKMVAEVETGREIKGCMGLHEEQILFDCSES